MGGFNVILFFGQKKDPYFHKSLMYFFRMRFDFYTIMEATTSAMSTKKTAIMRSNFMGTKLKGLGKCFWIINT
jgi:hypothetical protein